MAYRYLWTPLRLGPVTVRNRIVFSAHLTNYARDGKPTEQHAAYYAARAQEYDRIYSKPERQADLARLQELIPSYFVDRSVLEIATDFCAEYEVTAERLSEDFDALLADLLTIGAIEPAAPRTHG